MFKQRQTMREICQFTKAVESEFLMLLSK